MLYTFEAVVDPAMYHTLGSIVDLSLCCTFGIIFDLALSDHRKRLVIWQFQLNLQKQEKFSPEHPFILVWKNWLIQKKRFNLNDNEEFDTVCKMLSYIFDEDIPTWRLLVKRM